MAAVIQRPLRGSRISSFYPIKTLPSLSSLDSAFQLQEYISLLIRLDVHDVDSIVSIPEKTTGSDKEKVADAAGEEVKTEEKETEKERKSEIPVDEACWIYEQLRRLAQDLSHPLITMLQQECTRASCSEMKAGEWLYLCVAHGNDGAMEQCCAIDYILHTLDSATALLNSPRAFPSRISIPQTSHRHFSSLARRLGRIFAHAYFHHREAFEQAEAESSLYARFLALTSKFDLVPAEFLVIPPRLGLGELNDEDRRGMDISPPRLLAAAINPQRERERDRQRELGSITHEWERAKERSKSPPGLGSLPAGTESPRKIGRNRTDTMVYSEAFSVAEELAKADEAEADIEQSANETAPTEEGAIEDTLGTSDTGTVIKSADPEAESPSPSDPDLGAGHGEALASDIPPPSVVEISTSTASESDALRPLPEPVSGSPDDYPLSTSEKDAEILVTAPPEISEPTDTLEPNHETNENESSEDPSSEADQTEALAPVPIPEPEGSVVEDQISTDISQEMSTITSEPHAHNQPADEAILSTPEDSEDPPKDDSTPIDISETTAEISIPAAESEGDSSSIIADANLSTTEIPVEEDATKDPVSSVEPVEAVRDQS